MADMREDGERSIRLIPDQVVPKFISLVKDDQIWALSTLSFCPAFDVNVYESSLCSAPQVTAMTPEILIVGAREGVECCKD
jgi:hypothetical protein